MRRLKGLNVKPKQGERLERSLYLRIVLVSRILTRHLQSIEKQNFGLIVNLIRKKYIYILNAFILLS